MNLDASGGPMDAEEFVRLWDAEAMTIQCVESGRWIQSYKSQDKNSVWKHIPTDTYWSVYETRYGSAFSDFEYEPIEASQVKPVVEMVEVTRWAPV